MLSWCLAAQGGPVASHRALMRLIRSCLAMASPVLWSIQFLSAIEPTAQKRMRPSVCVGAPAFRAGLPEFMPTVPVRDT